MSAIVLVSVLVLAGFTGTFLLSERFVSRLVLSRRQRREEAIKYADDRLGRSRDEPKVEGSVCPDATNREARGASTDALSDRFH